MADALPQVSSITAIRDMDRRLAAIEQSIQPTSLHGGGGGSTSDGMTGQGTAIEGRLTRLESAAVAAFVLLMATFGGGYVLLSNQMSAGTEVLGAKMDSITSSVSELNANVAVLDERSKK